VNEQFRGVAIVPMRGPQQRCRAVLGSRVHVRTLAQQGTHLLHILLFRGVDEPGTLGGGGADNHQQRRRESPQDALAIALV
jgi:hypothetical protein